VAKVAEKAAVVQEPGGRGLPVLAMVEGRGRNGKSVLGRLLVGNARNVGRDLLVADWDRNNATLSTFYPDARRPVSAEDDDMQAGLTALLNEVAEAPRSLLVDTGGGDRVLASYGRTVPVVEFCEEIGVRPVAFVTLGPDPDDADHAVGICESGHFRPQDTVLVFNEGLVPPGRDTERAFAPLLERADLADLMRQGASSIILPRLDSGPMADVTRLRLDFWQAAAGAVGLGGVPVGPVQRSQLRMWLRKVGAAFQPIAERLP
jgi:hypothetical protein